MRHSHHNHPACRHAIVLTHMGARNRLVDMPWLEDRYRIDESNWTIMSREGWRGVAEGDATLWNALERKLLIGFYINQPKLVAVIGHPSGRGGPAAEETGKDEVRRIAQRVRSLLLPASVLGFWANEDGSLAECLTTGGTGAGEEGAFAERKCEPVA
jgi:hypothetical protein